MPRWKLIVAFVAVTAGIVATVGLGNWQTRRAEEKAQRQAAWDTALAGRPTALDGVDAIERVAHDLPQRVRLSGRFIADATVLVGFRMLDGVPGDYVVTPLELGADKPWVLVNRGWTPVHDARPPEVKQVSGRVEVEGLAVERVPRVLELGEAKHELGGVWQNLDLAAYESASGRRVARFVVQQTNETGDGLQRRWARPDAGVERHRGYAVQWYGLAAVLVVLSAIAGWRSVRQR